MQSEDSYLCVGLDPRTATAEEAHDVCCRLIDATKAHACCYKPNAAFFEAHGAAGWAALKGVTAKIHAVGSLCLLDCKRGDVGSTAQAYAKACYDDLKADAVTLSPYLGYDAIQPFVTGQYAGKGVFILCATSNPSADEMQSDAAGPRRVFIIKWRRLGRQDGRGLKTAGSGRRRDATPSGKCGADPERRRLAADAGRRGPGRRRFYSCAGGPLFFVQGYKARRAREPSDHERRRPV